MLQTETTTTTATSSSPVLYSSDLWYIHGKYYDLTPFIAKHPGGTAILLMCKGLEDATPCMESYHAFANRDYIRKTLQQFEVKQEPVDAKTRTCTAIHYTFAEDGFYMELTRRVRKHFGAQSERESVTAQIKINAWWKLKVAILAVMFVASFFLAFLAPPASFGAEASQVYLGALAGASLIMVGFTAMHDASHYALAVRDSWKNQTVLRAWNALALWDAGKWLYHHTVRHHSFTGDSKLDPDVIHARPLVRKHLGEDASLYYIRFAPLKYQASAAYCQITTFAYAFLLNYGQLLAYNVCWPWYGEVWRLPIAMAQNKFEKRWWEYALSLSILAAHAHRADLNVSLAYFTAASIAYGMCILADHDTYESAVENHVEEGEADWGEIQVRHASDFAQRGILGRIFTELFGSINVQIGHHLFPSVNHVHLPALVPIIKQCCDEFNVPYATHDTLFGALMSVSRTIQLNNEQEQLDRVKSSEEKKA